MGGSAVSSKKKTSEIEHSKANQAAKKLLKGSPLTPVPPPDLQAKYGEYGDLVWMSDSSDGDSDGVVKDPNRVVRMRELYYQNRLAEKKEKKFLLQRRINRMKQEGKHIIPQQCQTRKKPNSQKPRGHWVCVITKPCTIAYCEFCKNKCDHVAASCPYNEDRVSLSGFHSLCMICMKVGHSPAGCPYLNFVPRDCHKKLGRGGLLVCKCCFDPECHSYDKDWLGCAVYNFCDHCKASHDHSTEDCPRSNEPRRVFRCPIPDSKDEETIYYDLDEEL